MVLIFLWVLTVLTLQVSSFTKSNCHDFIANDEWPPIHPTSIHWIIRFGAMLEWSLITTLNQSQKQFPSLKMYFGWFGLRFRKKAIDNSVKDSCKSLQARVSANQRRRQENSSGGQALAWGPTMPPSPPLPPLYLSSLPLPYISLPFPFPLVPSPPLRSRPPKIQLGVWGGAPADKRFGAF